MTKVDLLLAAAVVLAALLAPNMAQAKSSSSGKTGFEGTMCSPGDSDPMKCMVCAIHFEDRNHGEKGMRAVAQNIMQRVESINYPNTICGVVHQAGQYVSLKRARRMERDPKLMAKIVKSARFAIAVGGNGFIGFRSYCRKSVGDIRIGGNCYRKDAALPSGLATDVPRDVALQEINRIMGGTSREPYQQTATLQSGPATQ